MAHETTFRMKTKRILPISALRRSTRTRHNEQNATTVSDDTSAVTPISESDDVLSEDERECTTRFKRGNAVSSIVEEAKGLAGRIEKCKNTELANATSRIKDIWESIVIDQHEASDTLNALVRWYKEDWETFRVFVSVLHPTFEPKSVSTDFGELFLRCSIVNSSREASTQLDQNEQRRDWYHQTQEDLSNYVRHFIQHGPFPSLKREIGGQMGGIPTQAGLLAVLGLGRSSQRKVVISPEYSAEAIHGILALCDKALEEKRNTENRKRRKRIINAKLTMKEIEDVVAKYWNRCDVGNKRTRRMHTRSRKKSRRSDPKGKKALEEEVDEEGLESGEEEEEEEEEGDEDDDDDDEDEEAEEGGEGDEQTNEKGGGGRGSRSNLATGRVNTQDVDLSTMLLRHQEDSSAEIVDVGKTVSIEVAAAALGIPELVAHLNRAGLPLDCYFAAGTAFRKALGLGEVTDGVARVARRKALFKMRCNPLVPLKTRERLVSASGEQMVVLAPMVWVIEEGFLSSDCKEAWVNHQNELPYCKHASGSGTSSVRVSRHRLAERYDRQNLTPIVKLGAKACVLAVDGTVAETRFLQLKEALAQMMTDCINEKLSLLCGEKLAGKEGHWRHSYSSVLAKSVTPAAPPRMFNIQERKEFFKMVFSRCSLGGVAPIYSPLPKPMFNLDIAKAGPHSSYGKHQDGSYQLNSDDERNPILINGNKITLPTRRQMIVITSVFGSNSSDQIEVEEDAETTLTHSSEKGTKEGNVLSIVKTYSNSCHGQGPGVQWNNIFHSSTKANGGLRMIHTSRSHMDPLVDDMKTYAGALIADGLHINRLNSTGMVVYDKYFYKGVMTQRVDAKNDRIKCAHWWNETWRGHGPFHEQFALETRRDKVVLPRSWMKLDRAKFQTFTYRKVRFMGEIRKGVRRPLKTIAYRSTLKSEVSLRSDIVNFLLERGIIMELHQVVKHKAGDYYLLSKLQPIFCHPVNGLPLMPGQIYYDGMPVRLNSRSHCLLNGEYLQVLCIKQVYKNDPSGIDQHIAFHLRFAVFLSKKVSFGKRDRHWVKWEKEYSELPEIIINLTGGSTQKAGFSGLNNNSRPQDPHYQTGSHQNLQTEEGIAIQRCLMGQNLITVVYDRDHWMAPKRLDDPFTRCSHLGEVTEDCDTEDNDGPHSDTASASSETAETVESEGDADVSLDGSDGGFHDVVNGTFNPPREIETVREEDANLDKGGVGVVGYFRVAQIGSKVTPSHEFGNILGNFSKAYVKANADNISYGENGHWQVRLAPALSFDAYMRIVSANKKWENKNSGGTADDVTEEEKIEKVALYDDNSDIKVDVQKVADDLLATARTSQSPYWIFFSKYFRGRTQDTETTYWPESLISQRHIAEHITKMTSGEALRTLDPSQCKDATNAGQFDRYEIDIRGVFSIMFVLMAAAALRADDNISTGFLDISSDEDDSSSGDDDSSRKVKGSLISSDEDDSTRDEEDDSTRDDDDCATNVKGGEQQQKDDAKLLEGPYAFPLLGKEAEALPDSCRIRPTSTPNSDFDLGRSAVRACIRDRADQIKTNLVSTHAYDHPLDVQQNKGCTSYLPPDMNNTSNRKFIAECIAMAIVFRFTGNVNTLQYFLAWDGKGNNIQCDVFLPTLDTVQDWIRFLNAVGTNTKGRTSMSKLLTKQHQTLPDIFKCQHTGTVNFGRFVENLFTMGIQDLMDYFEHSLDAPTSEGATKRLMLRNVIVDVVCKCAIGVQPGQALNFVVHQALADVESAIPDFAGPIDVESIAFGFGSKTGFAMMKKGCPEMPRTKDFEQQVTFLCRRLVETMQDIWLEHDGIGRQALLVSGWIASPTEMEERPDGTLVPSNFFSIVTGRGFSFVDFEHICCKVYVCTVGSYSSRTISEVPDLFTNYTWPMPNKMTWTTRVQTEFQRIRQAFEMVLNCPDQPYIQDFPPQLHYVDPCHKKGPPNYVAEIRTE